MKKALLLLPFLFSSQVNATLLTFDDIPEGSIQNNLGNISTYKGFNFTHALDWVDVEGSSWNYGAVSGDFALFTYWGGAGTITEETGADFTFDGLWAKMWGRPKDSGGTYNLTVLLEGYNNGTPVWSLPTSLNGSYTYYGAQAGLIDELRLGLTSGSPYIIDNVFLVDDIALTVSPVPEPSSIALMLGGLGLVGFMAARRTKKA